MAKKKAKPKKAKPKAKKLQAAKGRKTVRKARPAGAKARMRKTPASRAAKARKRKMPALRRPAKPATPPKPAAMPSLPTAPLVAAPPPTLLLPPPESAAPKPETPKPKTPEAGIPVQQPRAEKPLPVAPEPMTTEPETAKPPPGRIQPAFEMLPEWEDRERMRRFIREEGLSFFTLSPESPDYRQALAFLPGAKSAKPGHFIVCMKSAIGGIAGVMHGFTLQEGNVLFISGSKVSGERRAERHVLLCCAALALAKPRYVVYATAKKALDMELSGKIIFLGRGLGMSAIPSAHPSLIFIRRPGREYDPVASGDEVAQLLRSLKAVMDGQLDAAVEDFMKKGALSLIPLPTSPDTREHLHELRDAVLALALQAPGLEALLEKLKDEYVLRRNDVTPAAL